MLVTMKKEKGMSEKSNEAPFDRVGLLVTEVVRQQGSLSQSRDPGD